MTADLRNAFQPRLAHGTLGTAMARGAMRERRTLCVLRAVTPAQAGVQA